MENAREVQRAWTVRGYFVSRLGFRVRAWGLGVQGQWDGVRSLEMGIIGISIWINYSGWRVPSSPPIARTSLYPNTYFFVPLNPKP